MDIFKEFSRQITKDDFEIKFFERKDLGEGVYEAKKFDKRTGKEIPSKYDSYLRTIPSGLFFEN